MTHVSKGALVVECFYSGLLLKRRFSHDHSNVKTITVMSLGERVVFAVLSIPGLLVKSRTVFASSDKWRCNPFQNWNHLNLGAGLH